MEKNKSINKYIDNIMSDIKNNGVTVSKNAVLKFKSKYLNSSKSLEEIYDEIDGSIDSYLKNYNDRLKYHDDLKNTKTKYNSSFAPFLGETYKNSLFSLFKLYEEINDKNIDNTKKEVLFNTRYSKYMFDRKNELSNYFKKFTSDSNKFNFLLKESLLGFDSINYHSINNLYNVFCDDIDLVAPDYEGKMNFIVKPDVKIFAEDGSINKNIYDFSNITSLFNFAKMHDKQLKFGPIIYHGSVPENLKLEIESLDKDKRRKFLLNFIEDYIKSLSDWAIENSFNFRQIDVINDIAANDQKDGMMRNDFFSENLGVNPENGDNYYIDILKLVRKYFALNEIIITDYNEYDTSKCNRICGIVKDILDKAKRDNIKYLDGLGLQSHFSTWFIKNNEKCILNDTMIYKTMYNYKKLGIPLYRTECDFKRFKYDNEYYKNIVDALNYADNECYINGYILYGNSSKLTWYFCEDNNSNLIDAGGRRTKEFNAIKDILTKNTSRFNSNDNFNEHDLAVKTINYVYNLYVSSKIDLRDKTTKEKIDYVYGYFYNCFDSLIDKNTKKKKKLVIETIIKDLKYGLLIGCTNAEEFRDFLLFYNEVKNDNYSQNKVEEFRNHLCNKDINVPVKKNKLFTLPNICLFVFCFLFLICCIFLIYKCVLVLL